jgi:ABC-type transporter Mla MlaB component
MALLQVKVLGEDIAQSQCTGSLAGLHRLDGSGVAIGIQLSLLCPLFHGHIEIEGVGRVGKQFIGESVCDLLDDGLRRHICWATD